MSLDVLLTLVVTIGIAVGAPAWRAARRRKEHNTRVEADLSGMRGLLSDLPAIRDVVVGTPEDRTRGYAAVPSVAERLTRLERAVESREQLTARLAALEGWKDEHVRTCGGSV